MQYMNLNDLKKKYFHEKQWVSNNLFRILSKHNQNRTDMFNKQDVTVNLTYIKILKDLNILNFQLHIPEAIFKVLFQSIIKS